MACPPSFPQLQQAKYDHTHHDHEYPRFGSKRGTGRKGYARRPEQQEGGGGGGGAPPAPAQVTGGGLKRTKSWWAEEQERRSRIRRGTHNDFIDDYQSRAFLNTLRKDFSREETDKANAAIRAQQQRQRAREQAPYEHRRAAALARKRAKAARNRIFKDHVHKAQKKAWAMRPEGKEKHAQHDAAAFGSRTGARRMRRSPSGRKGSVWFDDAARETAKQRRERLREEKRAAAARWAALVAAHRAAVVEEEAEDLVDGLLDVAIGAATDALFENEIARERAAMRAEILAAAAEREALEARALRRKQSVARHVAREAELQRRLDEMAAAAEAREAEFARAREEEAAAARARRQSHVAAHLDDLEERQEQERLLGAGDGDGARADMLAAFAHSLAVSAVSADIAEAVDHDVHAILEESDEDDSGADADPNFGRRGSVLMAQRLMLGRAAKAAGTELGALEIAEAAKSERNKVSFDRCDRSLIARFIF